MCNIHIQGIPSDTVYTWSIINHVADTYINETGTDLANYSRVFPNAGTYEVVVLGRYRGGLFAPGGSFTTSITIIIRS